MAAVARKRRGIVRASLTNFKDCIVKFKEKELEVSDFPLKQCLIGGLEAMETKFKQHHQAVIDATEEDEVKMHAEQVILDDHDDMVSNFMD